MPIKSAKPVAKKVKKLTKPSAIKAVAKPAKKTPVGRPQKTKATVKIVASTGKKTAVRKSK